MLAIVASDGEDWPVWRDNLGDDDWYRYVVRRDPQTGTVIATFWALDSERRARIEYRSTRALMEAAEDAESGADALGFMFADLLNST